MAMSESTATELANSLSAEDAANEADLEALARINFCNDLWPIGKQALEYLRDNVFGGITGIVIRKVINIIIRVVDSRCGNS